MQLQFEKRELPCLHTIKRETQDQEQTQELRISDGMPDIGSIIGAWGQTILRSKEWQNDGMTVSGGTMVWVQYLPEEGGEPQCIESWLPFQMRWSFPETRHDGTILTQCLLKSVDARSTSARKMILRTNVSVLAWAMERQQCTFFAPGDVPEDVQLKTVQYPIQLPVEAGEKAFTLDETLNLPPSVPKMEKLISYCLHPEITEEKMMGDKVVFRGNALLHILYLADDGGQYTWDFDLPFTQYSELDGEYEENAEVFLWPGVTALEISNEENLNVKLGLVCQYCISHRPVICLVEDAYSPRRSVDKSVQDMELPGILEQKTQNLHIQQNCPIDGMRLTDVQFLPQPVHVRRGDGDVMLDLSGNLQMLYYDMEGKLHTAMQKWEEILPIPAGHGSMVTATLWPSGKFQGNLTPSGGQVSGEAKLMLETYAGKGIPMVTGLELGELQEPDPHRPSLILRRTDGQDLWELAKRCGSTVAAIQAANQLQAELKENEMLLIPVL